MPNALFGPFPYSRAKPTRAIQQIPTEKLIRFPVCTEPSNASVKCTHFGKEQMSIHVGRSVGRRHEGRADRFSRKLQKQTGRFSRALCMPLGKGRNPQRLQRTKANDISFSLFFFSNRNLLFPRALLKNRFYSSPSRAAA